MIVQLLEVLIGLVLVYLVFSTIASALVETVEMAVQKRGKYLETGIREILAAVSRNDDAASLKKDLEAFYDSPFISSLFRGGYEPGSRLLPSYIPAERFVDALLQLSRDKVSTFEAFEAEMRKALGDKGANEEFLKEQCIRYFNESMERVSGWYQRHAKVWLIGLAFMIAALGNVDTIELMKVLSQDESLREQVVDAAIARTSGSESAVQGVSGELELIDSLGLPIGWNPVKVCKVFDRLCPEQKLGNTPGAGAQADEENPAPDAASDDGGTHAEMEVAVQHAPAEDSPAADTAAQDAAAQAQDAQPPVKCGWAFLAAPAFLSKLFGILLTTFALSFGAPFWFDLLNELVNLRSSIKPKENEPDRTSAPSPKPEDDHDEKPDGEEEKPDEGKDPPKQ